MKKVPEIDVYRMILNEISIIFPEHKKWIDWFTAISVGWIIKENKIDLLNKALFRIYKILKEAYE